MTTTPDIPGEPLSLAQPIALMRQMSHDMRSPLGAIIATIDMLAEGNYDPLTAKQGRAVERVQRSSKRLLTMLEDLMTYVKAEANQYPLETILFEPRTLLIECIEQVRTIAESKGIELVLVIEDMLPTNFVGDNTNIKRIVLAVLWNAVAATSGGKIYLTSNWVNDDWIVHIQDTGTGISPEVIPHIFEPFWRGDERPQLPTAGCGLGLPMARALSCLMQGELFLESTGHEGSTFHLQIPISAQED
jgi:signal transduction histidine kinase